MDCAVIYSEAALADLEQITAFIAADNAEVAQRFANRLVDLAESLRALPERGRPVKKWPGVPLALAKADRLSTLQLLLHHLDLLIDHLGW
jgi:plasmid stabilization system protein ParE